ncbi:MAG: hypothetical protein IJZ36_03205, partial [Bacilli bacterium]|nr:hypothetical protein [Bacilli bacterium]
MLSLYGIMHSGFSKYYNFNYKRNRQYSYRHIYACLFFIADYENLIMYAYLQNELDEEFFQKGIPIKGLKSENGYLVGFDSTEPKQFRNVLILQRPLKIVWGRNNVAPGCDVIYRRLSIREGIFIPQTSLNCLFNIDCELDKSMHTEFINSDGTKGYIKRRLNYPLGLEYSVNEKIKMYNEWIKNNPTYTIEK